MEIEPRQVTAVVTFIVLIVLYCMPVLMLGWFLWSIGYAQIDYSESIPQMVVTFNSGTKSSAGTAPDLLEMLHRVLVPVATLISGLLAVTLSRSKLNYYIIGMLLFLIALVFATYVMMGISSHATDTPIAQADEVVKDAISTVLSRTFDTLFSFVLLFLGIAVAGKNGADRNASGSPPQAQASKELPRAEEAEHNTKAQVVQ